MSPVVAAVDNGATIYETSVSDIQKDDIVVTDGNIAGTLKYLDEGPIADYWGAGYFLAFQLSSLDAHATSVKVGLTPSAGSGLVEIINDPDKNGVAKITDKLNQQFTVVTSDGTNTVTRYYSLKDLVLE